MTTANHCFSAPDHLAEGFEFDERPGAGETSLKEDSVDGGASHQTLGDVDESSAQLVDQM